VGPPLTSVADAAKKHKVSEQTIYLWRKHFAGMAPADVKRRKALESENAKLKRLLAERDLARRHVRGEPKKMVSPQARRDQVRFVCGRGVSQRRACGLLGVPRSTMSYRLRLPEKDGPVVAAMRRCPRSTRATVTGASACSCVVKDAPWG
jgi:transposase